MGVDTIGNVWWSTIDKGLQCYSVKGELLHEKKVDTNNWFGTTMHWTPFQIDHQNRIFVYPRNVNELWEYFPEQDSIDVIADHLSDVIYCGLEDQQGNNWFATKDELLKLTPAGDVETLSTVLKRTMDFSGIMAFFQNDANILWVGTNGGLLMLPQPRQLFDHYFSEKKLGLGNSLRGITEGRGDDLYFYSEVRNWGLYHQDTKPQILKRLTFQLEPTRLQEKMEHTNDLIYDSIRHCIWAFTENLMCLDLANDKIIDIPMDLGVSYPIGPKALARFSDGKFLVGSHLGLISTYGPDSKNWYLVPNLLSSEQAQFPIKTIRPQGTDSIWVGTQNQGLFLLNLRGEVLQHYHTTSNPALSSNQILCIYPSDDGEWLWVGTFGGGLNRIHLPTEEIKIFTKDEGLADDNVVSITPFENRLWIATYIGLSSLNLDDYTFRSYFSEDGLSNNEFNFSSAHLGKNGRIYLGGLNGVNAFYPPALLEEKTSRPLQFMGYQYFNHQTDSLYTYSYPSLPDTPIVVQSSTSYFQFEWALPEYFKPEKNQYYTQVIGIDKDWVYHGNTPSIRFNGLTPGTYILRVKGADSRGNNSAGELRIPFQVIAPLHKRWWFILICIILVAGITATIINYVYRRKLAMEQIRTRIASDLHDEVGSMLSGLAMQAEMLELQSNDADTSSLRYMKDISRQAVTKMRDLVWSIDSRRDQMYDLLNRMRESATYMFELNDIDFQFESSDLPLNKKLAVDVRQHLYLIFREAVTNICKHSNANHVYIFFGRKEGRLELRIQDNGTVAPKENHSTGLGLDNMYGRAQALKGELTIDTENGFLVLLRI